MGFYIPPFIDYETLDTEDFPWLRLVKTFEQIKKLVKYCEEHNELPPFDMDKIEANQKLLLGFDRNEVLYDFYSKLIKTKII